MAPLAFLAASVEAPAAPGKRQVLPLPRRTRLLLTASEHYGSALNRPFDYRKYLDDPVDKQILLRRTFLLFREREPACNPKSPCKPDPADYITPWPRVGPGKALDSKPVFDLDQWNPEFFQWLHDFLTKAPERGWWSS